MQLDLEVLHRNRHEDTFQAAGDPEDAAWLKKELRGWLKLRKWHESRWGEFELVARKAGRWDTFARVRG